MSFHRIICLVSSCMLSLMILASGAHPARSDTNPTPVVVSSDVHSPWNVSVQPVIGSEAQQYPQLIGGNLTRRDTFEVLPIDISYGSTSGRMLSLTIPYVWRSEEVRLEDNSLSASDSGLGDLAMRLDYMFRHHRMAGWDGTFGFDVSIPTGKNIYDHLNQNELPLGTGHYETGVHLSYQKISDPVVVNFGAGVQYIWPRTREGEQIRPGMGFTIQTGIGYALSDRWVMTEELEFTRQPNVFLQSAFTAVTETVDQAYITHGFIYSRSPGCPSYSVRFSIGLNDQSTNFLVTLGVQH